MEARELAADDLSVLVVGFALAARELAAELTAVLAVLSVSPSSAPILLKLNPLSLSLSRGRAAVAVEGTDRLSTVVSEEGSANQNPDRRLRDFLN